MSELKRSVIARLADGNMGGAKLVWTKYNDPAAVARTLDDALGEVMSVSQFGARPTQSDVVNVAKIQAALNSAAAAGKATVMFNEPLNIAGGLILPAGVSLVFGLGVALTATQAMGPMLQSPLTTFIHNQGIYGGSFLCNSLANTAVDLQWFSAFNMQNFYFQDWLTDGVIAGNAAAATYSDGLQMQRVNTLRSVGAIPAGSRVVYLRAAGDNELMDVVPAGGEIGVQADSGGNEFINVHPWSPVALGLMKKGFLINGDDCYFTGCYADTPSEHGWLLNGNNYTLINSRAYNNGAVADNIAIGMEFTSNDPRSAIYGFQCEASDATHRFAIDVKSSFTALQSLTIKGTNGYNLATKAAQNEPAPYTYGTSVAQAGFRADGPAASNARGYVIATNGTVKWVIRSDNAAEPDDGSNNGCNLQIDRYDDSGNQLGQPLWIQRKFGAVQMTDSSVTVAGTYTKPFYMGAYAMWVEVATGYLRIKNGAPTSDSDGTIVGTQ